MLSLDSEAFTGTKLVSALGGAANEKPADLLEVPSSESDAFGVAKPNPTGLPMLPLLVPLPNPPNGFDLPGDAVPKESPEDEGFSGVPNDGVLPKRLVPEDGVLVKAKAEPPAFSFSFSVSAGLPKKLEGDGDDEELGNINLEESDGLVVSVFPNWNGDSDGLLSDEPDELDEKEVEVDDEPNDGLDENADLGAADALAPVFEGANMKPPDVVETFDLALSVVEEEGALEVEGGLKPAKPDGAVGIANEDDGTTAWELDDGDDKATALELVDGPNALSAVLTPLEARSSFNFSS